MDEKQMSEEYRNVMRHDYGPPLTEEQIRSVKRIKDAGLALYHEISQLGYSRELALAKTKTEEAVMWAVKHATA